jgi:teichuronic acid biosynthesis glycosyltransferase TuaH
MEPAKTPLLYLMHVNWSWARQRPHFIADGLSKTFPLRVLFAFSYRKSQPGKKRPSYCTAVPRLPLHRFRLIRFINKTIEKIFVKYYGRKAELIWITHPAFIAGNESLLKAGKKVIYDCMDDCLEFPAVKRSPELEKELFDAEKNLAEKADHVFVSSGYLKKKLAARYTLNRDPVIIPNAIPEKLLEKGNPLVPANPIRFETNGKNILYTGTISAWFDFSILLSSLAEFRGINYILIGPREVEIPSHERIHGYDQVDHDHIQYYLRLADALVMPFIVNELIRSVNPVKLYEYICSGKPVICPHYEELDAFKPFINTYHSKEEYIFLISKMFTGTLAVPSPESRLQFLRKNTWEARINTITGILR